MTDRSEPTVEGSRMTDSADTGCLKSEASRENAEEFCSKAATVAEPLQVERQAGYQEEGLQSDVSVGVKQPPSNASEGSVSQAETSSIGNNSESEHQQLYENMSYDELSAEFRKLFTAAAKAFQLIPQMYNRLTKFDGYDHKGAVQKMRDDHSDLSGFSPRNIRRYLPADNPQVPRRKVRTPRPKEKENNHSDVEQTSTRFTVTTQTELEVRSRQQPYTVPLTVDVDSATKDVRVRVDQAKFNEWNYSEGGED